MAGDCLQRHKRAAFSNLKSFSTRFDWSVSSQDASYSGLSRPLRKASFQRFLIWSTHLLLFQSTWPLGTWVRSVIWLLLHLFVCCMNLIRMYTTVLLEWVYLLLANRGISSSSQNWEKCVADDHNLKTEPIISLSSLCIRDEIIWECFLDSMSECRRESAVAPQPSLSPMGRPPLPPHPPQLLLLLLLNQRLVHLTDVKPTIQ